MAYRVRFHFRAKGRGVTCFSLSKVKDWRLSKHDTEGKWIAHDDVVVVPPDVTSTFFSVNNYHRPGKTMWFDDVSLVELPLSESPLTKRLSRAGRNLAALQRNTAPFRLTLAQEEQLGGIRSQLAATRAAYRKLEGGQAGPPDFKTMNDGLDAIETTLGDWLITVWTVRTEDALTGPASVTRSQKLAPRAAQGGAPTCTVGVMSLIDEAIAVRAVAAPHRAFAVRFLTTAAHARGKPPVWGELNSVGEILLPPGVPRFLKLELAPLPKPKKDPRDVAVRIEALDRTMAPGQFTLRLTLAE